MIEEDWMTSLGLQHIVMNYWLCHVRWSFGMSQILASVGQPTRIGPMWRIVAGGCTFMTNHLLIYNTHTVLEID
jgi:hypothetical protein